MDETSAQAVETREAVGPGSTIPRRGFLAMATVAVGGLVATTLAVPGVAFLLTPLLRTGRAREFHTLTRLSQLEVGVPRSFAIVDERQDAWVRYPREPLGSVWLVRQAAGADPPVIAMTSECPHLGCAINLRADGKSFLCPCHTSAFTLEGQPTNQVPPRPMDRLDVELSKGDDPEVRVRFQRFRAQAEESIPLV